MITVQTEDFYIDKEYSLLARGNRTGAIVTFVGRVRDFSDSKEDVFHLQHYPGMTEKVLSKIETSASKKWALIQTRVIHRVGTLTAGEQIVFVGVSSEHRKDAFNACEFIIDLLKTEAPFWKKEGRRWVEAKKSDREAADSWLAN